MAHSKQFMFDEINSMVKKMQLALTHIKTPDNHLLLSEEAKEAPVELLREGYRWVIIIFETHHFEWLKVRKLMSEEQWTRYYTWGGFDNHREMVMLRTASLQLRQAVISRGRPDIFKKSKLDAVLKKQAKAQKQKSKARAKAKALNTRQARKSKKQSEANELHAKSDPPTDSAGEASLHNSNE